MSKSKLLSLFVSAFYVIAFIFFDWQEPFATTLLQGFGGLLLCLSIPLGCIWFSDEIAVVFDRGRWPELNPNWAVVVSFFGWLLLLLPLIYFIVKRIK